MDTVVTHANSKGFALTSLSEVRCGIMPPQLKTKQNFPYIIQNFPIFHRLCGVRRGQLKVLKYVSKYSLDFNTCKY